MQAQTVLVFPLQEDENSCCPIGGCHAYRPALTLPGQPQSSTGRDLAAML